jgi:hypothetical protein
MFVGLRKELLSNLSKLQQTVTDSIEVHRLADVVRLMVSQLPLMLDCGYGCQTHGANGVVSPIDVAPMWKTRF